MKPLDMQTTVGKSQETARLGQLRERLVAGAGQAADEFRKDLLKKSTVVPELERPDTTRIEDSGEGSSRNDRDSGTQDRKHAEPKAGQREKDPQKGRIIDITAGFLSMNS